MTRSNSATEHNNGLPPVVYSQYKGEDRIPSDVRKRRACVWLSTYYLVTSINNNL